MMTRPCKTFLFLCSASLALTASGLALADDEGARIHKEVCSNCHTAKIRPLDKKHLTREQWAEAVERMRGYGADIPKAKTPELLDYLASTHGPAGGGTEASGK
jgi:mono/diheme cytochrome c family protein